MNKKFMSGNNQLRYNELKQKVSQLSEREAAEMEMIVLSVAWQEGCVTCDAREWLDKNIIDY